MNAENRRPLGPDVVIIRLHYHPHEWSTDDAPPMVYKFRVLGKPWGQRWVVHSVYANRTLPPEFRLRSMRILRGLINSSLTEQLGKEILPWQNDLLAWEE